jgi:hypothetical protein
LSKKPIIKPLRINITFILTVMPCLSYNSNRSPMKRIFEGKR